MAANLSVFYDISEQKKICIQCKRDVFNQVTRVWFWNFKKKQTEDIKIQ